MKVLLIGGGGREHALAWKLAQSPELDRLYLAPGNPGMARHGVQVELEADDLEGLAAFARRESIDLTVVGPEAPLVAGIGDRFRHLGLALFGPDRAAARLEGSKAFAKRFMQRHGIPTAAAEVAQSAEEARRLARQFGFPVVLKADGLAAGKGVLLPADEEELEAALEIYFGERRFGVAGEVLVVEEYLRGEEISCIALCDGESQLAFPSSKDYKRVGEGDTGPNTGGMGSHSPSGLVGEELTEEIRRTILAPTLAGCEQEGHPFRGVLYAGLMLTEAGPRVLEYNVRFGDPEAQALLLRLDDDLLPVLRDGAGDGFRERGLEFGERAAACVVLASSDYPGTPVRGETIHGLEDVDRLPAVEVFHAGTELRGGDLVTAGGRVLDVCATGDDLETALARAYEAAEQVRWPSRILRSDLGARVLERERLEPA